MNELKEEYNELLIRFEKATYYFETTMDSEERKEEMLGHFKMILYRLNYLLEQIEVYSEQEVMKGFR